MPASDLLTDPLLAGVPVREGRKLLGGVELECKLGQGGMGAVYKGRHLRLDVDVAVKVMTPPPGLSPGHSSDEAESFVKRFIREARTAAKIDHANLVRVFDVDSEHGLYFIVMQFVDGESAVERLARKGPLSEGEAGRIALATATGLAEAHRKGIVHRDVKPANILIDTNSGKVKVADLGLARAFAQDEGSDEPIPMTYGALGTAPYMSPEQTRSARSVGPQADVWSLGVTLYQLLTGRLPFRDRDRTKLIFRIGNDPAPDIKSLRADLSDTMSALIARSLRKDPARRFADCGEMAKALRDHVRALMGRPAVPSLAPSPRISPSRDALSLIPTSRPDKPASPEPDDSLSLAATSPPDASARPAALRPGGELSMVRTRAADEGGKPEATFLESAEAYYNRGLVYGKKGDLERAIKEFTKAIGFKPDYAKAYHDRGTAYAKKGDYDHAISDYTKAIELRPDDAEAYRNRGVAYYEKGHHDRAIAEFTQAIELDPDDAHAYMCRGAAYASKGDYDRAMADYTQAIELDPSHAPAYNRRGVGKHEIGDCDGAIQDYDRAIELDPDDSAVYCNRGIAKHALGDWDGAIQDYDRAIALDPYSVEGYLNRAAAKRDKGEMQGAMQDFNKAVEIDPDIAIVCDDIWSVGP